MTGENFFEKKISPKLCQQLEPLIQKTLYWVKQQDWCILLLNWGFGGAAPIVPPSDNLCGTNGQGGGTVINFITGRCGTGKSTEVMNRMKKLLDETELEAVLIVPEQQTVVWETKIAAFLPENQYLRVEVTNLSLIHI